MGAEQAKPIALIAPTGNNAVLDSLIREANGYLMIKDCKHALPIVNQALLIQSNAVGEYTAGKCAVQLNLGTEALKHLESAQKLGQNDPDFSNWLQKAQVLAHEDADMGQLESAHFHVWVEGNLHTWKASDTLFPELEKIYDGMCLAWDFYPANKLQAVLYESKQYQSRPLPDWTGALYDGKVRIPYNVLQNWPAHRNVLQHEVAHAFVHEITTARVDTWLDEGIAQHMDGTQFNPARLAAIGLAPLDTLAMDFVSHTDPTDAERLYVSSLGLFELLLQKGAHGNISEIKPLLTSLREGAPLAEQIKAHYGISLSELYQTLAEQVAKSKFAAKDSSAQGDGSKP